ncbi:MAG: hypothetical protein ACI9S9_001620 [Planctomycetota bacterium]|jgi:hypothetical protein
MKNLLLSGLALTTFAVLLPTTAYAHGGQYTGPGDTVRPPTGGGSTGRPSGPTTGGPAGPSAPRPTGPTTGNPAGPSTGGPPGPRAPRVPGPTTTGRRGAPIGTDLTRWSFWWEFNKAPFIRLRDSLPQSFTQTGSDDFYMGNTRRAAAKNTLRPSKSDILNDILPALKKAIDSTDQRDINSSCMIAMAKIGQDHPNFKLKDVFTPRLATNDQETRETAALALGIAAIAGEEEMTLLADLALDRGKGRKATGGSVNTRTRAFAIYGLGLTAHSTSNWQIKKQAFATLKDVLETKSLRDRNLKVAAINGMSILNIGSGSQEERDLLTDVVKTLETFYMKKAGAGQNLILSHCPPAIAKLIGRDHPEAGYYKELFAADLQERGKIKRHGNDISQSCALALGQLCQPFDDRHDADAKYSKLLLSQWYKAKDAQTRNFAVLSLGVIGGNLNRNALLKAFDKASKATKKPWCALALGVYSHRAYKAAEARGETINLQTFIGETLLDELKVSKSPDLTGALAVALGLNRNLNASDLMRERMLKNQSQEEMAGYLAIGLALMDDKRSVEDIQTVVAGSARRFHLMQQSSIALGKLGDRDVAERLRKQMTDGEPNLAKLSAIASSIGFIGDKRSIQPLKKLLFDDELGELSRAFAAVALGGIADKESLPWNSKIGVNMNYRANVETLTNKQSGILDIL